MGHRSVAVLLVLAACLGPGCGDDGSSTGRGGDGGSGGGGGGATTTAVQSVSTTGAGGLPESFTVEGVVVDGDGAPVSGASVLQGGGAIQLETGPDGAFVASLTQSIAGVPTIVAAKVGYRSAGVELEALPTEPIELVLFAVEPPDNALGYTYGHPGEGHGHDASTEYCGHCHTTLAAQFQTSAHARATRDETVQDLYAGVATALDSPSACAARGGAWRTGRVPGAPSTSAPRCYVGDGVLPDLNGCGGPAELACDDPALRPGDAPTAFGACADCHALGMDGPAGGRDLLEAEGIAYEHGNHCDACHHVSDVDLSAPPGAAGRLVVQRPREKTGPSPADPWRQAIFGPYPDVPNTFMGGSWQPKFSQAELCAGCHQQLQAALLPGASLDPLRWPDGLPVHSTYDEWLESPWAAQGAPCQACHMPPIEGLFNAMDVADAQSAGITFGFERAPEQLRSHAFRGPLTDGGPGVPKLLDGAVQLDLATSVVAGELDVTVSLQNVACGHAVPTGEPMRALALLVRVDGCGQRFEAVGGQTIDDVGGALARGIAGADVALAGASLDWPAAAPLASLGDVVRVVRPTGAFDDYDGVGIFAGSTLSPEQKGIERRAPVGAAVVTSIVGTTLVLDRTISASPGDLVWLGEPVADPVVDGAPSRALAGESGATFARVLVDPAGRRQVPHHRAVDLASDNRLRPLVEALTSHAFAVPPGCTEATVRATLLYRPLPLGLARERGWDARDHRVTERTETIALP